MGLCHAEWPAWVRCGRLVSPTSLPDLSHWTLMSKKKKLLKKKKNVHEKGRIVCSLAYMPRTFPVGFCGSFLPAMQIFFLICDIPTYTLFYCIHWELPDKSLFVKILLNICSNLKVCLNKNLYIASCILFIICTSSVSNHHWVNKAVIKGRRQ